MEPKTVILTGNMVPLSGLGLSLVLQFHLVSSIDCALSSSARIGTILVSQLAKSSRT